MRKMRINLKKLSLQNSKQATKNLALRRITSKSSGAKTMEKKFTAMEKKEKETCASTSFPTRWE